MPYKRNSRKSRNGLNRTEKKQVKKLINKQSEVKFLDTAHVDANIQNTSQNPDGMTASLAIPEGTDADERVGRQIKIIGLGTRNLLQTTVSATLRFVAIMVPQPAIPTDLLTAFNSTNMGVNKFLPKNVQKYRVLVDKTFSIDPDLKGSVMLKRYFKLNKVMKYDGALGADQQTFALAGYWYSDVASGVSRDSGYRLYFRDS